MAQKTFNMFNVSAISSTFFNIGKLESTFLTFLQFPALFVSKKKILEAAEILKGMALNQ